MVNTPAPNFDVYGYLTKIKDLHEMILTYEDTANRLLTESNRLKTPVVPRLQPKLGKPTSDQRLVLSILSIVLHAIFMIIVGILFNSSESFNDIYGKHPALMFSLFLAGSPIAFIILNLIYIIYKTNKNHIINQNNLEIQRVAEQQTALNIEKSNLIYQDYQKYLEKHKTAQAKLDELYSLNLIHEKYRNYNCALLFFEYFDTGSCKTLAECVYRADDYIQDQKFQRQIDLLNAKMDQAIAHTLSEVHSFKNSINKRMDRVQQLTAASLNDAHQNIEELQINMDYDRYLLATNIYDFMKEN